MEKQLQDRCVSCTGARPSGHCCSKRNSSISAKYLIVNVSEITIPRGSGEGAGGEGGPGGGDGLRPEIFALICVLYSVPCAMASLR